MGDHGHGLSKCKMNAEMIIQKLLFRFMNVKLDFYLI